MLVVEADYMSMLSLSYERDIGLFISLNFSLIAGQVVPMFGNASIF